MDGNGKAAYPEDTGRRNLSIVPGAQRDAPGKPSEGHPPHGGNGKEQMEEPRPEERRDDEGQHGERKGHQHVDDPHEHCVAEAAQDLGDHPRADTEAERGGQRRDRRALGAMAQLAQPIPARGAFVADLGDF